MTLHANLRAHAQEPHRGEITATASGEAPGPGQWRPVRRAGVSLVDQLAEHIALQIQNHGLRPGMRLPSVRAMAQEARLSRFTVVQAYDKLVAQGLIQSRKGSGFYVVPPPALMPAANEAESRLEADTAFDTTFLLRSMFRSDGRQGLAPATPGCSPQSGSIMNWWLPRFAASAERLGPASWGTGIRRAIGVCGNASPQCCRRRMCPRIPTRTS